MSHICRMCGEDFDPSTHQLKNYDYECRKCRSAREAKRRKERIALGMPVSSGPQMPREWHVAYEHEYCKKPEVKARKAEQARLRLRDPAQRHKHEARWAVRRAIQAGKLHRGPCEVCGAAQADAHHDDYSRPLDVRWLCRSHHVEVHKARGEG